MLRLIQRLLDSAARPVPVILPQADYNRVSETQLRQVKLRMNTVFEKNVIRPGTVEFEYDKQVTFPPPNETSDWDE